MSEALSYAPRRFDLKARLARLSLARLRRMAAAGAEAQACAAALARTGDNVVSEMLRGRRRFYEWEHYPRDDVYDSASGSQFYYHAHPKAERPDEHGHFHTFLRPIGMPRGLRPLRAPGLKPARGNDALAHLIAIAMDRQGEAFALFAANRWVTDETWYRAPDMIRMLDRFHLGHTRPSYAVNRWIGAIVVLFRPQIEDLLTERDRRIAAWPEKTPGAVYEDRGLDVTGTLAIDVAAQTRAVRAELRRRGANAGRGRKKA